MIGSNLASFIKLFTGFLAKLLWCCGVVNNFNGGLSFIWHRGVNGKKPKPNHKDRMEVSLLAFKDLGSGLTVLLNCDATNISGKARPARPRLD